jgi:hypothetical protein
MTDLASAAFRLPLRGLAVFNLAPGTKKPILGSNGLLDASSDWDVARTRWAKTPRANIAVATGARSNIWVLDVDRQHDGHKALAELTARHGQLPLTVGVHTPSGGSHMWWRWPTDGRVIRNSAGRIGPGIDVRGEGGYVVAPPSRLRDGRRYAWVRGWFEVLDAPDWLVDLALPPVPESPPEPKSITGDFDKYVAAAITDELKQLARAEAGARNDQLNRSAFSIGGFVRVGAVPEDWARDVLESRAVSIGLSARESRRTIESAFSAAQPREVPS